MRTRIFQICTIWLVLSGAVGCSGFGGNTISPDEFEPQEFSRAFSFEQTPEVSHFVTHYTSDNRVFMEKALVQRSRYWGTLQGTFRKYGLPLELTNVALVESGFQANAKNASGAAGMWQFMKPTAQMKGLEVGTLRDERLDVQKSTDAAARYLLHLFKIFDDWHLALAAYNGGQGRLSRAIQESGSREFFVLARRGHLSKETAQFVPKVIAATIISRNPERYGFKKLR